jgi:hypothetical protein
VDVPTVDAGVSDGTGVLVDGTDVSVGGIGVSVGETGVEAGTHPLNRIMRDTNTRTLNLIEFFMTYFLWV